MVACEVLRGETDRPASNHAQDDRPADEQRLYFAHIVTGEQHKRPDERAHRGEPHRDVLTAVKLSRQTPGTAPHHEGADDRGHHSNGANQQWEQEVRLGRFLYELSSVVDVDSASVGEQKGHKGHRGKQRARVALKKVGTHTGDVAHVVAHVVGDRGGVAGVVFGNPCLDLAHQVRTDVSGLCVNTAADTSEQGDRGTTQPIGRDHRKGVIDFEDLDKNDVAERNAQQAKTCDGETHHRAASEGEGQCLLGAFPRRLRRADVGRCGDPHTYVPGQRR